MLVTVVFPFVPTTTIEPSAILLISSEMISGSILSAILPGMFAAGRWARVFSPQVESDDAKRAPVLRKLMLAPHS